MKTTSSFQRHLRPASLALLALSVISSHSLAAADGTWKRNTGGAWAVSGNWQEGIVADGSGSDLLLLAPSVSASPAPYEITLGSGETRTLGSITQEAAGTGSWNTSTRAIRITGGTLHFSGTDTPVISGQNALRSLQIATDNVTGTQGLRFVNSGALWNPAAMSLTGGIVIESGLVAIHRGEALGNNTVSILSNSSGLSLAPVNNQDPITLTQQFTLEANALFRYDASSSAVVLVQGKIGQSAGAARSIHYNTGVNDTIGQRFRISGDHSYLGGTTVGGNPGNVLVLVEHANALGVGSGVSVSVTNPASGGGNTLGLGGGITITGKILTLAGKGYDGVGFDGITWKGSLFNHSGSNTWAGEVKLGAAASPRIGVQAGTALTLSGPVTGSAVGGLVKDGDGLLTLGAENSYTTGTRIERGTLLAAHDKALGSGAVTLAGGTLEIGAGISMANGVGFDQEGGRLKGGGTLQSGVALSSLDHRLAPGGSIGTLNFLGNQEWSGFTYEWEISDWLAPGSSDLVTIGETLTLDASGLYRLNLLSLDALPLHAFDPQLSRSWVILDAGEIVGFDAGGWTIDDSAFPDAPHEDAIWTLSQHGGQLILAYNIPEPGEWSLLASGIFVAALLLRRRS
ncbi:MAG TPA: hypothetical protein VNQ90_20180 [Chthoniobacteraceae bacterium]|nr:hypothetical protein [Chthoniobacteraceae bacterium]